MGGIGRDPIFIERGEGCELIDVDGNRYLDWIGSWGPLIHGHANLEILSSVAKALSRGTTFGAPTEGEVELAEEVVSRLPSAEMMRMTASGTEAAMSAVRLARAVTDRSLIVKFAGAYHGHSDGLLSESGSGLATLGIPSSPGVTPAQAADTVVVPWNEPDAVTAALVRHEVAAVIAEPVPANMGVVPPDEAFLEFLREVTDAAGVLLIFDEVITGFRLARGGAQDLYRVNPDLTVLGKVIGGGLPAAAYAGPAELMERIAPAGDVYQAGTLSGNPLAVAAGLTTLREMDDAGYLLLEVMTNRLAAGLKGLTGNLPLQVASCPGLVTLFFSETPVRDFAGALACDTETHARFCRAMLDRGVYLPPSQFEAWFVSLAHDDAAIDRTLEAVAESLEVAFR
jgi:glutamate-1-semialdehyde 2,1-aminomutase